MILLMYLRYFFCENLFLKEQSIFLLWILRNKIARFSIVFLKKTWYVEIVYVQGRQYLFVLLQGRIKVYAFNDYWPVSVTS